MKSLEERKEARAQQRLLHSRGIDPIAARGVDGKLLAQAPDAVSGAQGGQSEGTGDPLDVMTIPELREWVKAQNPDNPVEVPEKIKLKPDVLEYAKNYRTSLQTDVASGGGWSN